MTVFIPNVSNTDTFQKWLSVTNQLANAISNTVVTTDGGTAQGTASISGTYVGSGLSVNTASISANIFIGNGSVNTTINSTFFSGTANNSNYLGGIAAGAIVSNVYFQSVLSTTLNPATLSVNNANYIGGIPASNIITNLQLQGNLAYYALLSGGLFTGSVNATSYTVGTSLIANSTGLYTTGVVNVASGVVVANSTGLTVTNSSSNPITGITTSANGVVGQSNTGSGVLGIIYQSAGNNSGTGVYGAHTGGGFAGYFISNTGWPIGAGNTTTGFWYIDKNGNEYLIGSAYITGSVVINGNTVGNNAFRNTTISSSSPSGGSSGDIWYQI